MYNVKSKSNNISFLGIGGGRPSVFGATGVEQFRHFRKATCTSTPSGTIPTDPSAELQSRQRFIAAFTEAFVNHSTLICVDDFDFHIFDNWFSKLPAASKEFSVQITNDQTGQRINNYRLRYKYTKRSNVCCVKSTVEGPKRIQCYDIVGQIWDQLNVGIQMDLGQGQEEANTSRQAGNTIMTSQAPLEQVVEVVPNPVLLSQLCNTEQNYQFEGITDRFQLFESFTVSTSNDVNSLARVYPMPRSLYSKASAANLMAFRNFVYSDLDIEISCVVNAPRFGSGKLIMAVFPDGFDEFDKVTCLSESMLQREHVIIDLSKTNQGTIRLPNQFRRTFVRNLLSATSSKGVNVAHYSSLQVELLTRYRTGAGQINTIPVQLFYRFVKANFAGMSFAEEVKTQGLTDTLVDVGTTLFPAAKPFEGILKRAGELMNQDKPYVGQISSIVPQPRQNFSAGVGLADNIPLTLDHSSTVTILGEHCNKNDPKTLIDLAQKNGLEMRCEWKVADKAGTKIVDWPVNPSGLVSERSNIGTVPSPLKYVCNMTNMWRGSIVVRLDFAANDFHSGTVQLETMFNRFSDDLDQVSSTYTKTFDLGQGQQSVEYTIPYIYDTPWRRNNIVPDVALVDNTKATGNAKFDLGQWASTLYTTLGPNAVFERCRTFFRVTVINPLVPVSTVSQSIDVLMSIRAGDDFQVHSITPQQLFGIRRGTETQGNYPYGNFPSYYWNKNSSSTDPWIGGAPKVGETHKIMKPQNWNKFEGVGQPYLSGHTAAAGPNKGVSINVVSQSDDFSDPTADFTTGIAYRQFHSTDNQTRIKDVLRRNVLIHSGTVQPMLLVAKPKDNHWTDPEYDMIRDQGKFENGVAHINGHLKQSYWIPCFAMNQYDALGEFQSGITSPHAALTTLFRHWRGSLRYVFVFKSVIDSPIYITYVPQCGINVVGNRQQYVCIKHIEGMDPTTCYTDAEGLVNMNGAFAGTGYGTEICLTRINQTCAVTVPFDTNLNRCVVSRRAKNSSNFKKLSARDEVSAISGHLVVQCKETVKFDLFYSVGDDFELSDFVGCSKYLNQRVAACSADEIVQDKSSKLKDSGLEVEEILGNKPFPEGFRSKRLPREVSSVEVQMDNMKALAGLTVPLVAAGVGYTVARSSGRIATSIEAVKDKMCSTVDSLEEMFVDCGDRASDIAKELYGSLKQATDSWATVLPKEFTTSEAIDLVLDVIRLIRKFDYLELSLTVLKWLCKILKISWKIVAHFRDAMAESLKPLIGFLAKEQNSAGEPNAAVSFFGVLLGVVGTCYGLNGLVKDRKAVDLKSAFTHRMTDARGLSYFIAALNFVDYMFKAMKVVLNRLFGLVEPRAEIRQYLASRKSEIAKFIDDVEIVTNPANKIMLKKPAFKVLVWKTHIMAVNLKKTLIKMDPTVANMQLVNYCNLMMKFAQDKNTAITCSPVRYEPFVICLDGPSGIGKSSVNLEMICSALNSAGYDPRGTNPVYTRTPGKKHWDGYQGDLAITYDDWMNLSTPEQVNEQIAELYELKSRSAFMPQMADLADKGLSANPRIVSLLTNNAFPVNSVDGVTSHSEAVWRRRDVLVKVRSKYDVPTKDLSSAQRQNFGHLEFQFTDPINEVIIDESQPWLNMVEFQAQLNEKFQAYDQQEKENMMRELHVLAKFTEEETTILDDPTDILQYYFVKMDVDQQDVPELYPSAKLQKDLDEIIKKMPVPEIKQAPVQQQGFFDDAINWMSGYFGVGEEREREECSHCGGTTIFLASEGPECEKHQICLGCRVLCTTCVYCARPGSIKAKLGVLSGISLQKLAYLRAFAKDRYDAVLRSIDRMDHITKLQLRMLVFGVVMSAIQIGGLALAEKCGVRPQSFDEFQVDCVYNDELMRESVSKMERSPTETCRHKLLLENGTMTWIYSAGQWTVSQKGKQVAVNYAKCDRDCVLESEDGLVKYAQWIQGQCEFWFETYRIHTNRLLEPQATPLDSNDYLRVVPPCFRNKSLLVRSSDKWTNGRVGLTPELEEQFTIWGIEIPAWFRKAMVVVGLGLGLAGALVGVAKMIGYLMPRSTQIISSGAIQTRHFLKNRGKIVRTARVKTQSNAELKDALLTKIARNYVIIECRKEGVQLAWMVAAGIFGSIAVMPKHYLRKLRSIVATNEGVEILLHPVMSPNINVTYAFCESDFCESDTADLCVFKVPKSLNAFADIRRFIAKEKDLVAITTDGYLLQVPKRGTSLLREHNVTLYGFKKEQHVQNESSVDVAIDSLYYNFSENGACGSLVCRENHTRPILAMHFAGTNFVSLKREGYGVVLTQELFEDFDDGTPIVVDEEVKLQPAEHAKIVLPAHVEVQSLGAYPKAVFMPTKTKILPSKVQVVLEPPKTKPCYLSRQDKGYQHVDSPLVLGCAKHGILTHNFTTEEIQEVGDALWELKYQSMQPIIGQPKRLTLKEAIGGFAVPGYEAIKLDTSMGFPYVFNKSTLKKDYITIERDEEGVVKRVLVDQDVVKEQNRIDELRLNGVRPFLPYVDELKDERKAIKKLDKPGSTRVFCMSSIHSTIANRANFLHFSAAYTAHRIGDLNHAVGISRNGPEWTRLVRELAQVSTSKVVTMDYSNFGPGYNVMVNAMGHEIISRWTIKNVAGVSETELAVLGREHYNSDHIMNDLIYRQFSGGPSGDALTVVKNGLVNEMYIMLAWRHLMRDWCIQQGLPIYPAFFEHTKLVTYGDDLIMSVSDAVCEKFNGVTIKNFLATYRITATDALKTGDDIPFTAIEDASFLKSGFKPHPTRTGEWLAPLDEVTLEETPKWIRQCENHAEATEQNCEAALRDAFGHGKDFFEKKRKELNVALSSVGLKPIFLTWEELDANFFGKD